MLAQRDRTRPRAAAFHVNFRLAVADSLTDLKVQDRLVAVHRRGLQAKKMMAGAPAVHHEQHDCP